MATLTKRTAFEKGLIQAVSHLLAISILSSCVSHVPLAWTPLNEDITEQDKRLKENLSEVYRKNIYRIIDREGIHYMLYLKDYDRSYLYGYEYFEHNEKPKPVGGDLIEIPLHSIQEIEVRHNHTKSTLFAIGGGVVLAFLSIVLGVDLLGTDTDD